MTTTPGPSVREHRRESRTHALEDQAREVLGLQRAGQGEGGRHEGVLRHDDRAVAAREVLQRLSDRVVEVAHAGGRADADEAAIVGAAGLHVRRGSGAARSSMSSAHSYPPTTRTGVDRRLAHHRGDLVRA